MSGLIDASVKQLTEAKAQPHDAAYTQRLLRKHGYQLKNKTGDTNVYTHPYGHQAEVNMKTGDWKHIPSQKEASGKGNNQLATHLTQLHEPHRLSKDPFPATHGW